MKTDLQRAHEFAAQNLKQCCVEILKWENTGSLRDGKLRELAKITKTISPHQSLSIAEAIVKDEAFKYIVSL